LAMGVTQVTLVTTDTTEPIRSILRTIQNSNLKVEISKKYIQRS
jgi:hypothetical protein